MEESSSLAAVRAELAASERRAHGLETHVALLQARLAAAEAVLRGQAVSPSAPLAILDAAIQTALNHLPDVVVIYDAERRIRFINQATTAVTGQPPDHFLGKRDEELWPPEMVNRYVHVLHDAYRTGEVHAVETEVSIPGQPTRYLSITCIPLLGPGGVVESVVGLTRDATALHRAAAEQRRNQALYVEVARCLPAGGVAVVDRDLRYVVVEGEVLRQLGLGRETMLGRQPRDLFDPAMAALVEDRFRRCLRGERERYETHVADRWLWSEYVPLLEVDGVPTAAMAISMDVTERHQAAEELARLNGELELRVARRTADLQAANADLDSFAYAVSHDLRAPLRAMRGFSQALLEDFADDLPGEARDYLHQIGLGSRRMGDLIDGLLALSRSSRVAPRCEAVDLSSLAELCCRELAATNPTHPVVWTVAPGLVCEGDPAMLGAAVQNLLDNAWKYTTATTAPTVAVDGSVDATGTWLRVSDNGAGFDPAHAAKLFQPFGRLHRQDEFAGLGIGLATVQRIARRHGGRIEAHGEPGHGATFTLYLPVSQGES